MQCPKIHSMYHWTQGGEVRKCLIEERRVSMEIDGGGDSTAVQRFEVRKLKVEAINLSVLEVF